MPWHAIDSIKSKTHYNLTFVSSHKNSKAATLSGCVPKYVRLLFAPLARQVSHETAGSIPAARVGTDVFTLNRFANSTCSTASVQLLVAAIVGCTCWLPSNALSQGATGSASAAPPTKPFTFALRRHQLADRVRALEHVSMKLPQASGPKSTGKASGTRWPIIAGCNRRDFVIMSTVRQAAHVL
jgi:hypothetical protein